MASWVVVYGLGFAIVLILTDAPVRERVALALLWPIGPAAFVVTVGILLAASAIAFPVIWAAVAAAAALLWFVAL